jgi:hypothetical protein
MANVASLDIPAAPELLGAARPRVVDLDCPEGANKPGLPLPIAVGDVALG